MSQRRATRQTHNLPTGRCGRARAPPPRPRPRSPAFARRGQKQGAICTQLPAPVLAPLPCSGERVPKGIARSTSFVAFPSCTVHVLCNAFDGGEFPCHPGLDGAFLCARAKWGTPAPQMGPASHQCKSCDRFHQGEGGAGTCLRTPNAKVQKGGNSRHVACARFASTAMASPGVVAVLGPGADSVVVSVTVRPSACA